MNSYPHCSHNLLPHLRSQNLYWYCLNCRSETSDLFLTVQNRAISRKSELIKAQNLSNLSLVSSV